MIHRCWAHNLKRKGKETAHQNPTDNSVFMLIKAEETFSWKPTDDRKDNGISLSGLVLLNREASKLEISVSFYVSKLELPYLCSCGHVSRHNSLC